VGVEEARVHFERGVGDAAKGLQEFGARGVWRVRDESLLSGGAVLPLLLCLPLPPVFGTHMHTHTHRPTHTHTHHPHTTHTHTVSSHRCILYLSISVCLSIYLSIY